MKTTRSLSVSCLGVLAVAVSITTVLAAPTVSNVTFTQRAGTRLVDVTYNPVVTGANPTVTVALAVSSNAGATFTVPVNTVTGAVGAWITAGSGKLITWDAGTDWPGNLSSSVQVRVTAWALTLAGAPFVPIAGGGDELFLVSSSFSPQLTQLSKNL